MRKAKEIILSVAVLTLITGAVLIAGKFDYEAECYYSLKAKVVSVDSRSENVTVIDDTGNVWCFYGNGYRTGDKVSMMMDSKGTTDITDDVIVDVDVIGK